MLPMLFALVLFLPLSPSQSLDLAWPFHRLLRSISINLSDHAYIGPCPISKAPSLGNMLPRPCKNVFMSSNIIGQSAERGNCMHKKICSRSTCTSKLGLARARFRRVLPCSADWIIGRFLLKNLSVVKHTKNHTKARVYLC